MIMSSLDRNDRHTTAELTFTPRYGSMLVCSNPGMLYFPFFPICPSQEDAAPFHNGRKWARARFAACLYVVLATPFRIGFISTFSWAITIDFACDAFCWAELLPQISSAYRAWVDEDEDDDESVHRAPGGILSGACLRELGLEVLAVLPIELLAFAFADPSWQLVYYLRANRLMRLLFVRQYALLALPWSGLKNPITRRITFDVCWLLYIAHAFACLWYVLGTRAKGRQLSWIDLAEAKFGISRLSVAGKFTVCLYFSIVTVTSLGYGASSLSFSMRQRAYCHALDMLKKIDAPHPITYVNIESAEYYLFSSAWHL